MASPFTLGVEEEFQIVDPVTWELRSHVPELMAASALALSDLVKPEMHQSIVEVGTTICSNVQDLAEQIIKNRRALADAAERVGMRVAAAGTHPFSSWTDQVISSGERYKTIVDELQQLARSLLVFGLHVHIGVPDRSLAIELMNGARYFLPHLLALSTSSPFWMGRDTGLKSYRTAVFRQLPRTGIPDQFASCSEYQNYVDLLVCLHSVDDAKKIWWDVRPHPTFDTLEFRICDMPTAPRATIAIAALVQAIVVKLYKLRMQNREFRRCHRRLIEENKWRAARWGLDGNLMDFDRHREVPMRDGALELLEIVDDVVDELGSQREVEYVRTILAEGTSADRQLRVYRETGDLRAVVQATVKETRDSVEQSARVYRV